MPLRVELHMRRLRALVEVAHGRSVNGAAARLHVAPSAVTRAVRAFEQSLALPLFERSPRGMLPTACGELVVRRVRRAFAYLEAAERELGRLPRQRVGSLPLHGLVHKLAQRHLLAVGAIAEHGTETAAARHLGISQPAVTLALRDLEQMLDVPLFLRTAHGMLPTPAGEVLIRGAKLAQGEIVAAGADLSAQLGVIAGRLVVGALPLSGAHIAPGAIARVVQRHPGLRLAVFEGAYDTLLNGLRCGDIDVIVGALVVDAPADVAQERLFDDGLAVVARHDHLLTRRALITLADLAGAGWVLPYRRTGHRNTVERAMADAGLRVPDDAVEANSLTLVRGLLLGSDRLSVLSRRHVGRSDATSGLAVLPIELPGDSLPIGLTTRADAVRTAGLESLLHELRGLADAPAGAATGATSRAAATRRRRP